MPTVNVPFMGEFAFPIGAVYTNVSNANPVTELGYGVWTQLSANPGQSLYTWKRTA